MYEVLVITISKPLLIGVYENKKLIKEYKEEGKSSDILPLLFKKILKEYKIDSIIYVNTPGSFMSIKITYIFLKTLSMVNKISFKACDGFLFNENTPIKALGKKYFIKTNNIVKVDFIENNSIIRDFKLPLSIEKIDFKEQTEPIYNLPAV